MRKKKKGKTILKITCFFLLENTLKIVWKKKIRKQDRLKKKKMDPQDICICIYNALRASIAEVQTVVSTTRDASFTGPDGATSTGIDLLCKDMMCSYDKQNK